MFFEINISIKNTFNNHIFVFETKSTKPMPIRFGSGNRNNPNGTNPRGKGIFAILSFLFLLVFRKPKIGIPLMLIIAALIYFFGMNSKYIIDGNGKYGLGCGIDQDKYKNIEIFEPLASGSNKNKLPASFSLLKYAPKPENQGQQGSCVGWATAYAAKTIQEAYRTGRNPNEIRFSPSFIFNQIALPGCQGSYTSTALEKMKSDGLVYYSKFIYNKESCSKKPSSDLIEEAKNYKIRGYNRLSKWGTNYDVDIEALKQNIAQGAPVIIAMNIPESFLEHKGDLWKPKKNDFLGIEKLGGHAMCVIGYDDNMDGGAFHVMNSWGTTWGKDGFFWIRYADFLKFVREAYGLYPVPQKTNDDFDVSFGLVYAESNAEIPLNQSKGNLFRTKNPLKKGDKFKIEVQNNVDCFVYVFGQETDGSSYILFPYLEEGEKKSKYSPYCGIVGARHFPGGAAYLEADKIGSQDFMAVVVSKDELDYQELNERINRTPARDYLSKLNRAMGSMQITNPKFNLKASSVVFQGKTAGTQKAVGVVIAIDKK
jgi:C1A family cysteine protease